MKPVRTWILIADGARARFLENLGPGKGIHEVPDVTFTGPHEMSHELGSDQPGRTFESANAARHALAPRTDPHRDLKRMFAETLATKLADEHGRKSFDRLVLVAPPATMGDLRHCLSPAVRDCIRAEITEDLTKMPDDAAAAHIAKVVPI